MSSLYIARLCRWGNEETGHTYIASIHTKREDALLNGELVARAYRASKYEVKVEEYYFGGEEIKDKYYIIELNNENKEGDYSYTIEEPGSVISSKVDNLSKMRINSYKVFKELPYELKEYHENYQLFSDESLEYLKSITPDYFYKDKWS
jgi:hypothetical protein